MYFKYLFSNGKLVVTLTFSQCAYNQWKLNTFAYRGFNVAEMKFDATVKINGIFKAAMFKTCLIGLA